MSPAARKPAAAPRTRRDPGSLDDLDRQLLALLRDDARAPLAALGRTLHLGNAAVHERVRRLERLHYLQGYHAQLDYDRLGLTLGAYVGLQTQQSTSMRSRLTDGLRDLPEIEEANWVTGDFDVLLKLRVKDPAHLQRVIFKITQLGEGQIRSRTLVILGQQFSKPGPEFELVASEP